MEKPLSVSRYVGVELEVSEDRWREDFTPRKTSIWHKKRDGSVHYVGTEYVFKKKEIGKTVIDGVNYLCDMFDRHDPYVGKKRITTENVDNGFHLHLDYSHKTAWDAIRLCDIAYSIQDWMYECVADTRHDNKYCLQYDDTPSDIIRRHMRTYNEQVESACGHMDRYDWIHAVNMSYYRYKTVEVRLHHGTGDRDEILTWIEWWTTLSNKVDKGKIQPCKSIDDCRALLNSLRLSEKTYNRFSCALNRVKENAMLV